MARTSGHIETTLSLLQDSLSDLKVEVSKLNYKVRSVIFIKEQFSLNLCKEHVVGPTKLIESNYYETLKVQLCYLH